MEIMVWLFQGLLCLVVLGGGIEDRLERNGCLFVVESKCCIHSTYR